MQLAITGGPEQLQSVLLAFLQQFPTTEARVQAVEEALNGPAGPMWRGELGKWTTMVIPIEDLVPEAHREWRPLVRDAMRFVVQRLSAARLAPKVVEQMEAPAGLPADVRLLKLITKVPGLQKIGQTVARNRHVDARFRAALAELENSISDVTIQQMREIIRKQLGLRLARYQVRLSNRVLSEASVSAVVSFTWRNPRTGRRERGVFKVLKPHVPAYYAEDMDILQRLAAHLSGRHRRHQSRFAAVAETIGDVMHLLEREVDFHGEQETLRAALGDYRSVPGVRIPHIIDALCTDTITAMGHEEGAKITDAAVRLPRRRREIAQCTVETLLGVPSMGARRETVFHADPHAGNLLYDGRRHEIVILDWALAERLAPESRRRLLMLALMMALRDPAGVTNAIEGLRLHMKSSDEAHARLVREMSAQFVASLPLFHIAGPMDGMRLLDALAREGVRFPAPLAMFRKAMFTLDGVVEDIAGGPVEVDAVMRQYALAHWARGAAALFSVLMPTDWVALQWSALTFLSRTWMQALRPAPVPVSIG